MPKHFIDDWNLKEELATGIVCIDLAKFSRGLEQLLQCLSVGGA